MSITKKIKPYFPFLLSFGAGAILTFAFAPYYQGWLAFLSPILLLRATETASGKKAFIHGFSFGCGFFGFSVYWVFHSIYYFGQTTPLLAYLITGSMIALLALYPAFMMSLTNYLFKGKTIQRACIGFPVIWVLAEMVRGYFLTGFPWAFLGTTQIANAALRAYAPIGSVWMVSWVILISAGILYSIILYLSEHREKPKQLYRLVAVFVFIWVLGGALYKIEWVKPENVSLDVALIQGNIPQRMRWSPEHVAQIMNVYENQTKKALSADVIVWPEGAIPLPLPYSNNYFQNIQKIAKDNDVALIAGVPEQAADQDSYYNALIGLGLASGIYYKERLVPFGEFVPFEKMLRGLIGFFDLPMSSFIQNDRANNQQLTIFGLKVAPAICYEIAFPTIVRKNAYDADFIITVSNDTWFGRTNGPKQHLEIAQWRAIETGRYILRATNTGLTAIISPNGHSDIAPQFEPAILFGKIFPMRGQTPWVTFGITPLLALLLITLSIPLLPGSMPKLRSLRDKLQKYTRKKVSKSTNSGARNKNRRRRK
ncbi:apolipoprotein N-acyltransferase [Candidatus Berkiella cookevillensis]|uniref:Apolipoprotein N-acyltransferase n=1 Tax=Candidatus Berkiella cookevillensis TaxID=437022 RepID=A0A0Q9YP67_9GAMM|nr:apolipoprotein N-acyltransferase [Candidatus Berkiella cookevillensis]MCS5707880.1 apolipoprotein N-acyltransferase [Candidatus Berkiella cookevillensis]